MSRAFWSAVLIVTVFAIGSVMIVAGAVSILLHGLAWPFAWMQDACTRWLRDLNPRSRSSQAGEAAP